MQLTRENIQAIPAQPGLTIPGHQLFELPEKVLQFGTGVLLRGLPDYFIDKANRQGIFNGRIVMVKSTTAAGADAFARQDGLYTICIRGIEKDRKVEEAIISSAISRVLSASHEWKAILACAHNPAIRLIISNTTEIGIVFSQDNIREDTPASFPGKLLAFLWERYKAFNGSAESGLIIIPTELITDNASKLRAIVLELSIYNKLEKEFIQWMETANHFCNSLVDRIVPGKLTTHDQKATQDKLGYTDELMIMAESFRLWAIESDNPAVKAALSFSEADEGVIITDSIEKFRELKLRLLNGTHTFSCAVAFLAGFDTVKEAMQDEDMAGFIRRLMMLDVAEAMDGEVLSYNEACAFANSVLDRFRNPFIDHHWLSITMNFTSKMRLRNIPLLLRHHNRAKTVPAQMAIGFAAYLLFMNCQLAEDGLYYGNLNNRKYVVQDDMAAYFSKKWAMGNMDTLVSDVLADRELWGEDLSAMKDFSQSVKENLFLLQQEGALSVIRNRHLKKTNV